MQRILRVGAAVVAAVAVLLAAGSCKRSKQQNEATDDGRKFKIEKLENFSMTGLTSCEVQLLVTNGSGFGAELLDATVDIFYGTNLLGSIVADLPVSVPKRSTVSVTLPLSLQIENPLALYGVYGKLSRGETDKITLSLRATVKAAGSKHTVEQTQIPLSSVLSLLGVDAGNIKNLLNF